MFLKFKLFLISILMSISCTNDSKLAEDIALLQSRSIEMPKTCQIIADGRDTSIATIFESDLKLIVYIDSTECSPCIISKMYKWDGFIEYAKLYENRLRYCFIYSPSSKDVNSVRIALRNNIMFNYPILLDNVGEFEKINPHISKNKSIHAFLIDTNNNVILVGNPLYNKKIEEIFYKIVENKLGNP